MLKATIKKSFLSVRGNFEKFNGILPLNVTVKGNILVDGNQTLIIDGNVIGDIEACAPNPELNGTGDQGIVISGAVRGNIFGFDYVLLDGGHVTGSIQSKRSVVLKNQATVLGDVAYGELAIESGSTIEGKLSCLGLPAKHQGKYLQQIFSWRPKWS